MKCTKVRIANLKEPTRVARSPTLDKLRQVELYQTVAKCLAEVGTQVGACEP